VFNWRMIGLGKEIGGLYHLLLHHLEDLPTSCVHTLDSVPIKLVSHIGCNFNPFSLVNNYVHISANVWHSRLSHLSDSRLHLLQHVIPDLSSSSNKDCSVCPLAKQHCISFPISNNRSTHIFDIIHCDIWGPFSTPSSNNYTFFLTIVDDFSRFTWGFFDAT